MNRTLIRVFGTAMILAVLWFAMGASIGIVQAVSKLIIPKDEWLRAYGYGTWIDLSIWALWGLGLAGAIWAIRVLFRRAQPLPKAK